MSLIKRGVSQVAHHTTLQNVTRKNTFIITYILKTGKVTKSKYYLFYTDTFVYHYYSVILFSNVSFQFIQ